MDAVAVKPPGRAEIDLLVATMTEPFEIRSMLRNEIASGEREVVRLTDGQHRILNEALRADGRPPELVEAAGAEATVSFGGVGVSAVKISPPRGADD